MTRKQFHVLVVSLLLICLVCPFVEMAVHSNGNIFQTGQDGETSVAVLLLLLELLFAVSISLAALVSNILVREDRAPSGPIRKSPPRVSVPVQEFSPPLPLRI